MSRRTSEANKAIRLAWERERELVRQGRGTRDWTKEQQEDILNPDIGKAYDSEGRAFEGQHMKSVAEYPEYQGNPDNIQFLTKEEHLEAHKGNWQNPTNWYYDPITKTYDVFGEEELIRCKEIQLSDPLPPEIVDKYEIKTSNNTDKKSYKQACNSDLKSTEENQSDIINERKSTTNNIVSTNSQIIKQYHDNKKESFFKRAGRWLKGFRHTIRDYYREHPEVFEEMKDMIISTATDLAVRRIVSSVNNSYYPNLTEDEDAINTDNIKPSEDRTPTPDRDLIPRTLPPEHEVTPSPSYSENDVPAHKQRYHTKEGIIWKDKKPYHRGGNDDEKEPD